MKALYLLLGILITSMAFERSRKWGGALLIIVVLGLVLTAQRKAII